MSKQRILLIVEGTKTEKILFEKFYQLYNLDIEKEIWCYGTSIYQLYRYLQQNFYKKSDPNTIDFENLDMYLVMKEYLGLSESLDDKDFNEIFLVFDFDPQVPGADFKVLKDLIQNCNDSLGIGKLFINYPMIESYKDYSCLNDPDFINSHATKTDIFTVISKKNQYKRNVGSKSFIPHVYQIDKEIANYIMESNVSKIEHHLNTTHHKSIYEDLLDYQIKVFLEKEIVYVINTSVLHLYDEYGFINYDNKH